MNESGQGSKETDATGINLGVLRERPETTVGRIPEVVQGIPETQIGADGRATRKIGNHVYTYTPAADTNYSENTRVATQHFQKYGITYDVYSGDFQREINGNVETHRSGASMLPDGTILLNNDSNIPGAESAGHEMLHEALKQKVSEAQRFLETLGDAFDPTSDVYEEFVRMIYDNYAERYRRSSERKAQTQGLTEQEQTHCLMSTC